MPPNFELYMINIDWNKDTKQIDKICLADNPLELESTTKAGINYKAETFCYERLVQEGKKLDVQLAVKSKLPVKIRRMKQDGTPIDVELYNFHYNNESWWIEKGSWKDAYYDCPSFHKAGKQTLKIGNEICEVTFAEAGFEPGEFEALLGDFESDLWQILLAKDSTTSAQRYEYKDTLHQIAGSEVLEPLRAFIKNAEQALRFPKVELREQAALQPAATVRPVPRTFMELAVKGNPAKLTGRAYYGSYNTPENRYLAGMTKRLLAMVKSLANGSTTQQEYLKRQKDRLQERIAFLQKGVAIVDKRKLENQIKNAKTRLKEAEKDLAQVKEEATDYYSRWEAMRDFLVKESQTHKANLREELVQVDITFKVNSVPKDYGRGQSFYVYILEPTNILKVSADCNWSLEFSQEIDVKDFFQEDNVYSVKAYVIKDKELKRRIKEQMKRKPLTLIDSDFVHILRFQKVEYLELIQSPILKKHRQAQIRHDSVTNELDTLKDNKKRYEQNGWQENLDKRGLEDAKKEREALVKKLAYVEARHQAQENYQKAFPDIKQRLEKLLKRFVELNVEPSRAFPGSMTFIQNPHYRGCHARFCEIVAKAGIKEDLFDRVLSIQEFGIVNLYDIYERWCLLQIIKVLTEEYHFEPQTENWKEELVRSICSNDRTNKLLQRNDTSFFNGPPYNDVKFCCNFVNLEMRRRIELAYDLKWARPTNFNIKNIPPNAPKWIQHNNPDFELNVLVPQQRRLEEAKVTDEQNRQEDSINWEVAATLVLDAKCKSYVATESDTSLSKDLKEIAATRDYGKGGQNYVFVLHRGREAAIANAITNQEWSAASYYGGKQYYDWQPDKLDHKQGGVMLRPFFKSREEDDQLVSSKSQDDLKRLIGMVLEMGVEAAASKGDPHPTQKLFCIVCGGVDIIDAKPSNTSGSGKKYCCTCNNSHCGHIFYYNYCWNHEVCENRRLFKHDSYWTYHDTHVLSPYNIRCPVCGQFADDNSKKRGTFEEVDLESLFDEEEYQRVKKDLEQTKIKKGSIPDTNLGGFPYWLFPDDPFDDDIPVPEH